MKGLVYKEMLVFFKGIDKKPVLILVGGIILLMFEGGIYAGLLSTVMLAMTVGIINVMCYASDEKAGWKKYQMAMPLNAVSVVGGKYISVVCTLAVSFAGSLIFNLLSSVIFHRFNVMVWGTSIAVSILVPLWWTGICLPLTYWFGFRAAQTMGMIAVIPVYYFVKFFEDGAGFSAMMDSVFSYAAVVGAVTVLLFFVSMIISIIGCNRKK